MAHDVFVSHSSKDKTIADAVCATLESRLIRCWIAPRDILPGEEWDAAVIAAIKSSKLVVLVFSAHSNDAIQVHREVKAAFSKGVPVIPLRLDKTALSEKLEFFMGSVHWLDAITPPLGDHLKNLADSVQALLAGASKSSASRWSFRDQPEKRRNRRVLLWGSLIFALLGSVVAGLFLFAQSAGSIVPISDFQRLQGRWQKENSISDNLFMEFFPDGTFNDDTLTSTLKGTYKLLPHNRIELRQEGVLWGENSGVIRYDMNGRELLLTPANGSGIAIRCKRVD